MRYKDMGEAERALIEAKIEMKKLKKNRTKASNKRIKQLEGRFPTLNRNAYLEKKNKEKVNKESYLTNIWKEEEKILQEKIKEDLEKRKNKPRISQQEGLTPKTNEAKCQSCGYPLRDVYGITRCNCT